MLKKVFNNKKLLLILGIVLVLIIVIIVIFFISKNKTGFVDNPDGIKIKNEFEELNNEISEDGREYPKVTIPKSNILKYATIDEVLNIFNNGDDAVLYLGYPTCIYCRNAIQVLVDTATKTNLEEIYYLNVDESDSKYSELVDILGGNLTITENDNKKVYIPLVLFITNGKVSSYNKGTLFSQEDPYVELDDSQKRGLSEIYSYGIGDVMASKKLKDV